MRFNKGITLFSCLISLNVVLRRIQGCFTDTTAMCGRIGIQLIWSWTYNDRIDDRVNIALRRSSGLKWKQTIRSEMNILIFLPGQILWIPDNRASPKWRRCRSLILRPLMCSRWRLFPTPATWRTSSWPYAPVLAHQMHSTGENDYYVNRLLTNPPQMLLCFRLSYLR